MVYLQLQAELRFPCALFDRCELFLHGRLNSVGRTLICSPLCLLLIKSRVLLCNTGHMHVHTHPHVNAHWISHTELSSGFGSSVSHLCHRGHRTFTFVLFRVVVPFRLKTCTCLTLSNCYLERYLKNENMCAYTIEKAFFFLFCKNFNTSKVPRKSDIWAHFFLPLPFD